jgi:hypothetical protein
LMPDIAENRNPVVCQGQLSSQERLLVLNRHFLHAGG